MDRHLGRGLVRHRVNVEIKGGKQSIGNDYSRDLDLPTFAKRYIVATDPAAKLSSYPPRAFGGPSNVPS